jgi:hypothetical protein
MRPGYLSNEGRQIKEAEDHNEEFKQFSTKK